MCLGNAARCQEDQIQDLVARLLEAKLLLPADRKFKKPKPGKKKLVKFPRTLEPAVVSEGTASTAAAVMSLVVPFGAWAIG
jgi:translocation protein SEC62